MDEVVVSEQAQWVVECPLLTFQLKVIASEMVTILRKDVIWQVLREFKGFDRNYNKRRNMKDQAIFIAG